MAINRAAGGDYGPTPQLKEPGVMYAEADRIGAASRLNIADDDPINVRKGNLSTAHIPGFEPRALSHAGSPWKNMKGGR